MERPIEALQAALAYRFNSPDLLVRALTHRSWRSERESPVDPSADNEQFEFLGDSVLGFVVSESLVNRHPSASEGQLSKWKAHLVSAKYLYERALALDLGRYLRLGKGEEKNLGRGRKSLLANAFEAVIAAVHIDGGIDAARSLIETHVLAGFEHIDDLKSIAFVSHKNVLHEKLQSLGLPLPEYRVISTSGPDHVKVFTVEAKVEGQFVSRGVGSSKKEASQQAAQVLLNQIERAEQPHSPNRVLANPTLTVRRTAD
jgi:ribonuclease-3